MHAPFHGKFFYFKYSECLKSVFRTTRLRPVYFTSEFQTLSGIQMTKCLNFGRKSTFKGLYSIKMRPDFGQLGPSGFRC